MSKRDFRTGFMIGFFACYVVVLALEWVLFKL
jgi:hypothetical protein